MKKLSLFLLFAAFIARSATSQTITGTVTHAPCNNDGIYSVTTTGIPLPITYHYYVNDMEIIHANVNATTDQLTNFGMSNSGYIYSWAESGGVSASTQSSYTPQFTFSIQGTSPVCPVVMGTITATHTGGTTGPFSYVWTNTQTGLTYSGNNASVPVGSYSTEITDQTTGCVLNVSDTMLSIQQLSNITATINQTAANCTNGTASATAVTGGVAPYSYLWSNGATSSSISGLSMGYYPLTITDAQGCQSMNLGAYVSQAIQIPVNVTETNATCVQSDGSAMAFASGGVNPYTYIWSNGQTGQTASGLSGGSSYTVIATDANGCVGIGDAYIQSTTPINVSYTSTVSQCTSPTGSATLTVSGGTAPYTYSWALYPSVTGPVLSNVAPGTYSFQVTDAVGCIRTGTVVVNPVSTITTGIYTSNVLCPATTGTVTMSASGTNGPFTYSWSNGATTNVITGVALGTYSCTVTDALGCYVTRTANLSSVSPVNLGTSMVPVSCIYATDGSASVVATGGTAPYTYSWTGGATTATASSLGVGQYYVNVTDANGCSSIGYVSVTNANTSQACYCTISGDVYVDANANCTRDGGENGVQNIMIHCSGFGYAFTDANGHYSFQVPTGTYTISEQVNQYYPLAACQNNSNTVSVVASAGCNNVVDFANTVNTIHDLKIVTMNVSAPPIPGNTYNQKVIVMNQGTVTESGIQLGYEADSQIPFVSATLPAFVQTYPGTNPDAYGIQSGFPVLNPNGVSNLILSYSVPTTIPLGTSVTYFDSVADAAPIATEWMLDYSPWNNVNTFQTTVVGSYDPNYKEVSPKGYGAQGFITSQTKEFDYTIHFQNEGTYFAQNIVVTDQLDSDFDWTTFKPGYSDYAYTTTMSETGLVTFTFANIHLPWKQQYGDALSSALVHYSIERKTTTPEGTEFTNTANIYFDYNAPITTNTTLNTLNETAGIEETGTDAGNAASVDLYPVPVNDHLTIRVNNISGSQTAIVSVIDLTGKVVLSDQMDLNEGTTELTKNLSGLMTGTYLTRIQFENGASVVKKFVLYKN